MSSMFWGLRLEPGKRYTATVDKPFHVSMAALDCSSLTNDEIQTVMLEEESNTPFILCNLQRQKVLQARLDLNFVPGNRVTFFCRGSGSVHLTGYVLPEDEDEDDDDDYTFDEGEEEEDEQVEEEEEDEDKELEEKDLKKKSEKKKTKLNGLATKRKPDAATGIPENKKKKSQKKETEDEEDSDEDVEGEEEEIADFDEGEEEEVELESDDVEDSEEEEKVPPVQEQKKIKKKKKNKQNKQNLVSPQQQQQQGKQKQNSANGSPQQDTTGQQKKKPKLEGGTSEKPIELLGGNKQIEGGVIIKDMKIGNGPVCKPGKQVTVYYTGRLKANNKVFDSTQQGPGFKFRLGRGEVIKGWDIGVTGMKVGGKRRVVCPPSSAYGQKGSPPTIPPNSTLVFDVEVKAVN